MSIVDSIRAQVPPIHPEGYPFIGGFALASLIFFLIWTPLGWIGTVLTVWCALFFRDPRRVTPLREGIVDYFAANPPEGSYFAANSPARAPEVVRHVIARGETLSEIAARYRVSSATIKRTNSLTSDVLRVGQVLMIPRG